MRQAKSLIALQHGSFRSFIRAVKTEMEENSHLDSAKRGGGWEKQALTLHILCRDESYAMRLLVKIGALLLIFVISLSACSDTPQWELRKQEENDWYHARYSGSIGGYQKYLDAWPTGRYTAAASHYIEGLSWQSATWAHTQDSYRHFIQTWPDSLFVSIAEEILPLLEPQTTSESHSRTIEVSLSEREFLDSPDVWALLSENLTRETERFLECAGLTVSQEPLSSAETAVLRILIGGKSLKYRYEAGISVSTGATVSGTIEWLDANGQVVRASEFKGRIKPPSMVAWETTDTVKLKVESLDQALSEPDSYRSALSNVVYAAAGPRAFLCGGYEFARNPVWQQILESGGPVALGAAVSALYTDTTWGDRDKHAAILLAEIKDPRGLKVARSYLDNATPDKKTKRIVRNRIKYLEKWGRRD